MSRPDLPRRRISREAGTPASCRGPTSRHVVRAGRLRGPRLGIEEIRQGNLDTQTAVRTRTEIGALAQAFNRMARRLREAQEQGPSPAPTSSSPTISPPSPPGAGEGLVDRARRGRLTLRALQEQYIASVLQETGVKPFGLDDLLQLLRDVPAVLPASPAAHAGPAPAARGGNPGPSPPNAEEGEDPAAGLTPTAASQRSRWPRRGPPPRSGGMPAPPRSGLAAGARSSGAARGGSAASAARSGSGLTGLPVVDLPVPCRAAMASRMPGGAEASPPAGPREWAARAAVREPARAPRCGQAVPPRTGCPPNPE